jgi:16S rRNA (adenine1518-N6/adenine1519-N6)-dimethyltransferase
MRRKGQSFLVDRSVLERIADYAELTPRDVVLEIGPGTGNLTEVLSRRAGQIFAVEVDPGLAADLKGRLENVSVIKGDALKLEFPEYNKIASNLPYQISSKITLKLVTKPFDLAVLMYQREFARRLLAQPGTPKYGRLAMVVGHYAKAELLELVPRRAFLPQPSVGSAIVILRPRPERPVVDEGIFLRLVTGLFRFRRKKVRNALESMGISEEALGGLDASILEKRPEELAPDEVARMAQKISLEESQPV